MSCTHPENHPEQFQNAKGGTIVLTKNDRYKIRTGKVLEFHFHGLQFNQGRITFFVSNRKKCVHKTDKLCKLAIMIGEVCPIIVDKEEMKQLESGVNVLARKIPCEPEYEIVVCTSEQWHSKSMEHQNEAK